MGSKIKAHVASKILECYKQLSESKQTLHGSIYENLKISVNNSNIIFSITPSILRDNKELSKIPDLSRVEKDSIIQDVSSVPTKKSNVITFTVNKSSFIASCLEDIENVSFPTLPEERIVIDYSSPNIAKPFHVGHFRSTIIGNFIANISNFTQNSVVRLNYLGDWGTQIGLLKIGLKELSITDAQIKENPIQTLYQAYVKGNAAAAENTALYERAKKVFCDLEKNADVESMDSWQSYKEYTVSELMNVYKRLNVTFDTYSWESDYATHRIKNVLDELGSITTCDESGLKVVRLTEEKVVPIQKSDGSSLYITRDIAAAIDRHDKYNFSKMIYVTDLSQSHHFEDLFKILERLNYSWSKNLMHIKFGRISGMSTRKGQAVFLKDILDEAKMLMMEKQKQSPNTRDSSDHVADVLGISAVLVNDLKQRKIKNYEFCWDNVLQIDGDTGIKLQYTHCRLKSLEERVNLHLPKQCDPSVLMEPEAVALVVQIAAFDETILKSYATMEAYVLVNYLFKLSNCTNKALKVLRVKDESEHIASQRLLLFHSARTVLCRGMKILGLTPLDAM